ncbi:MAG: hypothetical protein US83_C0007G0010 [Candidatus Falkowbacteria bacterium GW2011_GWC2_38_22]|uniref:SbsA Ig-like domain-containing protein n=1 Tax=Candidatus Falkowbacteria bacterium GW2011_GWE1_38_31 TaxID=1618638 RepID=A0A0G0JTF8_9BACT|nr:MAG: hypothetical protein US73_C0008G0047 [Candidatus Falkowbacteria bacterium GW2011_GWF2_38_1205]KKQ61274.1 MAG: hypothetical protein US83_C0007G0010 [Candidatus Falkowbacteria bacterium GW2011_GWC2_38_22]KKQ63154.1 MAG: hypothetical protein US84_C0008G0047 [Candidatus Falkowbacteria bacterium GW2011_GWF1_38_22]KKQ65351.1 MAG: hypothetical protein US87_C0008G0047 [Candidatus Falkowbacteria bacterium GW2011_GWE2_38_254]KKQ69927.1 MAG: hypothetical protein US91_C0008G0047 [Candidatus Falkowb
MIAQKNKLILLNCLIIVAVFFIGLNCVSAQTPEIGIDYAANVGLIDPGDKDVRVFIVEVVRYFITFLGIIAVAMVMYAGFLWMTSGGDPEKVNKAKSALINSVIGLIIIISAFAIVTLIINFMEGGGGNGAGGNKPIDYGYGLGAYGNCAISSTYPEPFQKDVPRNTAIIVTFVEEVDQNSIISAGKIIDDGRIKIYKKGDEANFLKNVSAVNVSGENKTFLFSPDELLGSPSENTEYYVFLSNDILKLDGKRVFDNCLEKFAQWSFEISTKVDLTPPQVKEAGVFPTPDNNIDTITAISAEKASGEITFFSQPAERRLAAFAFSGAPLKSAVLSALNTFSTISGSLSLAILADGTTARIENSTNGASLGTAVVNGRQLVFPNFFTLTLPAGEDFAAGDSWTIMATAYTAGDTFTVGDNSYYFGSGGIALGGTTAATTQNAKITLDVNPAVTAAVAGGVITITARDAGVAGNSIVLGSSNSAVIGITRAMSGGRAAGESVVVSGRTDRPRNSVIQINFNEAINPIGISGKASDISNNIFVENISAPGVFLEGRFIVSNQYRTIEFLSDDLCGVNSCGEKIYCLPANSNLRVVVKAASLATCPGAINCAAKAPYVNCVGGICKDGDGRNYPMAGISLNGAADMAFNSLDGDRDLLAEGPSAQSGTPAYDENEAIGLCVGGANNGKVCTDANKLNICGAGINCQKSGANVSDIPSLQTALGDDFEWSFFIGSTIKASAPVITAVVPSHRSDSISLVDPLSARFDGLMMSASLGTGQINLASDSGNVIHKRVNLRSLDNRAVGYWTAVENIDNPAAIDGEADWTNVEIRHPQFFELLTYRPQVGSGVKDIYQNCFKPSEGPLCVSETSDVAPSCCPVGADIGAVGEAGLDGKGNCK